jgi:hypothetical protein
VARSEGEDVQVALDHVMIRGIAKWAMFENTRGMTTMAR